MSHAPAAIDSGLVESSRTRPVDTRADWQPVADVRRMAAVAILAESFFHALPTAFGPGGTMALRMAGLAVVTVAASGLFLEQASVTIALATVFSLWCGLRFPETSNTEALILWTLIFTATAVRRESARVATAALGLIPIGVLLYSASTKWALGNYDRGEFLAMTVARRAPGGLPTWLIPPAELSRLRTLASAPGRTSGPFFFESTFLLVVANAIPVLELGAALILAIRRFSHWSWAAALAVVALLTALRENFVFGFLLAGLILLFAPDDSRRRIQRVLIGALAVLAGARALGWLSWLV